METPGAVVDVGGSGEAYEGHSRSEFVSGKGAEICSSEESSVSDSCVEG